MILRLLFITVVIGTVYTNTSCTTIDDCSDVTKICSGGGCIVCQHDSDCTPEHTLRTHCDTLLTNRCVQCSLLLTCGSGKTCVTDSSTYLCGSTCSSPTSSCGSGSQCIYLSKFYCMTCEINIDCQNWSGNSNSQCKSGVCSPAFLSCRQDSDCTNPASAQCSNNVCSSCTDSSHCSNHLSSTPHCNSGTCVECLGDNDCTSATAAHCSTSNTCVACTASYQCTHLTSTPVCKNPGPNEVCVQCTADTDCSSATAAHCSGSNTCGKCTASTQCAHLTSTPLCNTTAGSCAICLADSDCSSQSAAQCSSNNCVGCTGDSHCTHIASNPVCKNPGTGGICVECVSDSNCSSISAAQCSTTNNTCIACTSSDQCADHLTEIPLCNTTNGVCVQCLEDSNCNGTDTCSSTGICMGCANSSQCNSSTPTTPICSTTIGQCVQCQTDSDCSSDTSTGQCSTTGTCVGCTDSTHCKHFTSTPACNTSLGICVECVTDADCPTAALAQCSSGNTCINCTNSTHCAHLSSTPVCQSPGPSGLCVECISDSDCPSNATAQCSSSNICVPCSNSSQCIHLSSTPVCNTSSGTCVGCLGDSDCPSTSAAQCSSNNTCEPCTNSSQCTHLSPTSVCSTIFVGVCVECDTDSECPSITAAQCSSNGTCIACTDSSNCVHLSSTPLCNMSLVGVCVQCNADTDCSSNSTSQCSSNNTCIACTNSTHCSHLPTTPVCKSPGVAGLCVECLSDSDCQSTSAAQCSSSNTCVACTDSSHCSHLPNTTQCNTSQGGVCVQCNVDADCPSSSEAQCESNNTCGPCSYSSNCAHLTSTPVCSMSNSGDCVQCNEDSDCPSPTAAQCSPNNNTCIPCSDATQCAHFPSMTMCAISSSSGVAIGTCTPACVSNCMQCINSTSCKVCLDGYYLLNTTACLTTCPSGYWQNDLLKTCDLCNSTCKTCNMNANNCTSCFTPYVLDGSICRTPLGESPPTATLTSSSDPETFLLVFSNPMAVTPAILIQTLQFSLTNMISNTDYYLLNITEQPDSKTFELIFNFTESVGIENLTVIFTNQKAIADKNGLIITQVSVSTKTIPFAFFTNAEKAAVKSITSIGSATSNVALGSSVGMAIIGGSGGMLWAFIGLFQMVNYLMYLNVNYPYNVVTFFSIFNVANINIIPNPIQYLFPSLYNEMQAGQLPSPPKYYDNSMDAMYLNNAGQTLTGWVIVVTLYILTKIILFVFRTTGRFNRIITKFKETFEWGLVYNAFIGTYPDLLIASCLQFTNMNFTNAMYVFSSIAALVIGACCFFAPFVVTYALESSVEVLGTELHSQKHGALYETFIAHSDNRKSPEKGYYRRNFMAFIFLRKMAYFSGIVLAYYIPILQMVITCCSGLVLLIFMIRFTPFRNKRDAWMNIGSEVFMVLIHAVIFVFAGDDIALVMTATQRKNVGWAVIVLCSAMVAYNAFFILVQQVLGFWIAFKLIKRVICKKKQNANKKAINESENQIITKKTLGNQEELDKNVGTKGIRARSYPRNNFMQAEKSARHSKSSRETSKLEVKRSKKIGILKTAS